MNRLAKYYKVGASAPVTGRGRYAYEHWVNAHPNIRPCDLYDAPGSLSSYGHLDPGWRDIENPPWNISLQKAPRQELLFYGIDVPGFSLDKKDHMGWGLDLYSHIAEWIFLYRTVPANDSWLWKYYSDPAVRKHVNEKHLSWLKAHAINVLKTLYPGKIVK